MAASTLENDCRAVRVFRARVRLTAPTYHRPRARLAAARSALATGAAAIALLAATAAPAGAATLLIEGAGEGHGVGMSQDGALGLAQHGLTYTQILSHYYTGTSIGQAPPNAVVRVLMGSHVKRVPLERYVRGVIGAEMPSSWPAAALEAQAVAARTYALTSHAGGARFDVYSDTRSQVYRGRAAETASTVAAAVATAGQIVLYAGKPVPTYYFASSGGATESIQNSFIGAEPEPWLVGVPDPYESSARWRVSMTFGAAAKRLRGLFAGRFRGIEVLARGVSPRIVLARVLGTKGDVKVSGPELAARLGLGSAWAFFSVQRGTQVAAEPDHSGASPSQPQPGATAPAPPPAPATPQGGAQGPAAPINTAGTGGAPAAQ
ncbi:MAG TPA: SpoIID/LytB domain-containing protein [Solirubrobacteraceae bacterium]|nr:SpoIID/LytB domain-containing protein [Solirubrobacteraceae bacterium]